MPNSNVNELIEIIQSKIEGQDFSALTEKFAAEFRIENEGVFYIEALNGKITIAPYEYNDRDIIVNTTSENLKKILDKKLGIEKALITRKITVSGNLQKAKFIKNIFKAD